jgi:ribonuclease T1
VFPIGLVSLKKALAQTLQRVAPRGSAGLRTDSARADVPKQDRKAWGPWLVSVALGLAAVLAVAPAAQARTQQTDVELPVVALAELPPQAQATYRQIERGGPFDYAKDGSVFGNRERLLPARTRGYYREYTVKTPGSKDRGARRIICGGPQPAPPAACFYTDDHYASFRRIVQ